MMQTILPLTIVPALDEQTVTLVRLAAAVAAGSEAQVRRAMAEAVNIDPVWVEELILQSYLFAGFPRTLNAMREWRKVSGRPAPERDDRARAELNAAQWRADGEETCAKVYDGMYERLRENIAELHPALDAWMVVDGYGKVLSRPGLDLARRELCIVAVCAAAKQDRQLQSHLHGALNVGATPGQVVGTLVALADMLGEDALRRDLAMFNKVSGKQG
ncbi:MAG: carboxymuconolactone decarboxylase family protein [Gemmatimonadaceae bacterium]|nr:carboxymuconolactone decarboxylase family protein [Gemmatimonadaceae bacterium]NUQ93670.1 carboxymuconolactone decarboxylase family protein [Gemmatimonadaceae bacterium]NUR18419.1 carboxymuconolactone decarboxylase family protein [Gemmatimonadaceae bacterium]NUS98163.1 carboxymuconolactone decarboxylase family protein [Gemmatimonadaceae bacterium]